MPYQNNQFVESVYIELMELENSGNIVQQADIIVNNYSQLLSVAGQCPAAGGEAVYRARVMLTIINDSLEYDDVSACLQVGIYREKNNDKIINQFKLIPNPAKDLLNLLIDITGEGVCIVEISNSKGTKLLSTTADCKNSEHAIDVASIPSGVYFVSIYYNGEYQKTEKLIIIK